MLRDRLRMQSKVLLCDMFAPSTLASPMPLFSHFGFTLAYSVHGEGEPLVLLHGNTGASRMLTAEIEYYSCFFRVIAADLTGHGSSPHLGEMPDDFRRVNADLVLALCAELGLPAVHLMGTSGGAIVALNMALQAPGAVRNVIADSFLGTSLEMSEAQAIARGRQEARNGPARDFWMAMHGDDWESVVDADSRMLLRFARSGGQFFRGGLTGVLCPVLLTASLGDEIVHDAGEVLRSLVDLIPNADTELLESGGHPAMLSNAERFRSRAMRFLRRQAEAES